MHNGLKPISLEARQSLRNKLTSLAMGLLASTALLIGNASLSAAQEASAPAPVPTHKAAAAGAVNIPIPDIQYTKFVLANGLTVLVHEDHKAPIVAVNTWYHVGSKNEKPGRPASPTCSST